MFKKKLLCLALTLMLLLALLPVHSFAAEFADVGPRHWAYDTISVMAETGILNGYPNGLFLPENLVTRGEWAKVMALVANLPIDDYVVSTFDDVNFYQWHRPYIESAKYYLTGIRIGGRNLFLPDQGVSRADAAVALVRLMGYEGSRPDHSILRQMFRDYDGIAALGDAMLSNIAIAVEKGLMLGYDDQTFRPNAILNRGQAATLLYRMAKRIPAMDPVLDIEPASVLLNLREAELTEGEALQLDAKIYPDDARIPQLVWHSSDSHVAYVDTKGNVTALSEGSTVITVQSADGKLQSSCVLMVYRISAEVLQLNQKSIELTEGEDITLYASVLPQDAPLPALQWTSGDLNVVHVSRGKVTALGAGTAVVTARTSDGRLYAQCTVTVTPADLPQSATPFSLWAEQHTIMAGDSIWLGWELPAQSSIYEIVVYEARDNGDFMPICGFLDGYTSGFGQQINQNGQYFYKVVIRSNAGTTESNIVSVTVEDEAPGVWGPVRHNIAMNAYFTAQEDVSWAFDAVENAVSYLVEVYDSHTGGIVCRTDSFPRPFAPCFGAGFFATGDYVLLVTAFYADGGSFILEPAHFSVIG